MEYVQLVVPQHLYEELGLHLNQTIILSNSQSLELDTLESNSNMFNCSDEASSQHHKLSLTKSDMDNKSLDQEASLENALLSAVNSGNVKQKIVSNQLKPNAMLSDSQNLSEVDTCENDSDNSMNAVDLSSPGELHPLSCDVSVPEKAESNKTVVGEANHSLYEYHNVFQGKSVNAKNAEPERVKHLNPMYCSICCRGYLSKGSFRNHRKKCEQYANYKYEVIVYPRRCTNCNRIYKNANAYYRHKGMCEEFKKKSIEIESSVQNQSNVDLPISIQSHDNLQTVGINVHSAKDRREKVVYPRSCPKCSTKLNSRNAFRYHTKKCFQSENARDTNENISHPTVCMVCNQIYFCKTSYLNHKQSCWKLENKRADPQTQEDIAQLLSWEVDTCGNDKSSSNDSDKLGKESCALNDDEKLGKWVPIATDSGRGIKYFVVNKTSSLSNSL